MSPLEFRVILHYHVMGVDIDDLDNKCYQYAVDMFINHEMMKTGSEYEKCSFSLTEKGRSWMHYVLDTPFPVAEFTIPKRVIDPLNTKHWASEPLAEKSGESRENS